MVAILIGDFQLNELLSKLIKTTLTKGGKNENMKDL